MKPQPDLETQVVELEADFFQSLSEFQQILSEYHQAMLLAKYDPHNEKQIQLLSNGLKTMAVGFTALSEAFPAMCQARGLKVSD